MASTVWGIIALICFVLMIVFGIITMFIENEYCEFLCGVLLFTFLFSGITSCTCDEIEKENKIQYSLEHNYSCYIDGEEVDPSLINFNHYRHITFDDENERIIIASNGV